MNAQVINVSAPNEVVINKGSDHGISEGLRVNFYSSSIYGTFKAQGDVSIVHRKVSVIKSNKDDFLDVAIGDIVRDHI